jgi:hypothetical protein
MRKAAEKSLMEETKWRCGVLIIHQGNEQGHASRSCPVKTITNWRDFRKGNFMVSNGRLSEELSAFIFRV